jgi:hypothetical protein
MSLREDLQEKVFNILNDDIIKNAVDYAYADTLKEYSQLPISDTLSTLYLSSIIQFLKLIGSDDQTINIFQAKIDYIENNEEEIEFSNMLERKSNPTEDDIKLYRKLAKDTVEFKNQNKPKELDFELRSTDIETHVYYFDKYNRSMDGILHELEKFPRPLYKMIKGQVRIHDSYKTPIINYLKNIHKYCEDVYKDKIEIMFPEVFPNKNLSHFLN